VALLKASIELPLSQDAQNSIEVVCMVLLISNMHKNVIKVHNGKLSYDRPKHLIHKSHEGARCISQTKRHDKPPIKATLGFKSRLPLIPLKDSNLVIATSKINLRKDGASTKFIKYVPQPWNGTMVFDCDLIDSPTINTNSHTLIFLRQKHGW